MKSKNQTAHEKKLLRAQMPKINLTVRDRLLFYGGFMSGAFITMFYVINSLSSGIHEEFVRVIISTTMFIISLIGVSRFSDLIDYLKKNEN